MGKITMKDVARMAEVSMSTVSRVLNNPESVHAEKRQRVLKVIEAENYHPNALARGLVYKRTQSLGVLLPDISNGYVAEVIRGMEDTANSHGHSLILCNTDMNRERMLKYLRVLKEKQVDGIIFMSEPVTGELNDLFTELQLPVVLASTQSLEYNLPSVKVDDEQAAYDAAVYLIEKGHRKIGMISGPTFDVISGATRYYGFQRAVNEKLGSRADGMVEFGHYRFEDGYIAMKRLYGRKPDITAVFAASDEMAVGAITYLREKGMRVPGDVSVMGYDNTKFASMYTPKLTTVAQPMYEIGSTAVEKMIDRLDGEVSGDERTYLSHKIVERESVAEI
ncbi:LacI family DNA-binding transcriptional regulator [Alteribacter natronophilus]|uniref:LacI family DNA-binding transcriptional regulator n=1 Tax=Alteribacter natronophilus TaxID=2583810 RepID=UPI00110E0211|nr:LacI family DNA-binding transcriptional regulator [Alteribacter natronophilus]TMW72338.1 LacI family transcriptional regulator [Alteribacter natronophilus]